MRCAGAFGRRDCGRLLEPSGRGEAVDADGGDCFCWRSVGEDC